MPLGKLDTDWFVLPHSCTYTGEIILNRSETDQTVTTTRITYNTLCHILISCEKVHKFISIRLLKTSTKTKDATLKKSGRLTWLILSSINSYVQSTVYISR